jgi:TRAP-type mannitol/chloroaromatic compound transport system permease small subunit
MAEGIGNYFAFVWKLVEYFYEKFFVETGTFFTLAMDGPFARPWEFIVAAFFVLAALAFVGSVGWSVVRMSPRPFIHVTEYFCRFFGWIGAWIIIVLIVTMVYEVIARYFFDSPTQWAFEMGYMLMGTSFMLGLAVCMQMRRHIRVDFVYDNVGPKGRAIIDLVGYFFLIPMLLWLTAGLFEYFQAAYNVDETSGESAWNPIIWPFKFAFVMGMSMLLMQTIAEIVKDIMTLSGVEPPEPVQIEGQH